jgi:hypothetical protein
MRATVLVAIATVTAGLAPDVGRATSEAQFQVRTTADLVALCSTPVEDPLGTAAVNFCEGFAVGAYQYHQIAETATQAKPLFCLPSPPPSRDRAIAQFIEWSKSHSDDLDRVPIEGIFTFLKDQYPCR